MKKTMTRNIVIMAIVTVIMAVVLSLYIKNTGTVPAADNTASLADGTYTASEQGCLSEVAGAGDRRGRQPQRSVHDPLRRHRAGGSQRL